jgi:hypothetical protein
MTPDERSRRPSLDETVDELAAWAMRCALTSSDAPAERAGGRAAGAMGPAAASAAASVVGTAGGAAPVEYVGDVGDVGEVGVPSSRLGEVG